jgi:transposase InsO family protein
MMAKAQNDRRKPPHIEFLLQFINPAARGGPSVGSPAPYAARTFRTAFAERGNPAGVTFHSDRGGQYISDTFTKLLREHGVTQFFSAPGCPHDTAVAERFFATFKKEEAYRKDYTSERASFPKKRRYVYSVF